MEKSIENKNKLLKIAPFAAAVALVVYVICVLLASNDMGNVRTLKINIWFMVPIAIANFIIVKSYNEHNKNLMKSLIGFILSGLVLLALYYALAHFELSWFYIVKVILLILIMIFTLNHFLLSNNHYSRPSILFINQAIMSVTELIALVATIVDSVLCHDNPLIFMALLVFVLSTMIITLIIEMRVNEYKLQREKQGYIFVKSSTNDEMLDEEDMFISNKVFYFQTWLVVIGLIALFIFNAIFDKALTWGYAIRYIIYAIKIVCLFTLVLTYKSHNKNVMKVMLGFLLGLLFFENLFEVVTLKTSSLTSLKSIATIVMLAFNVFFLIHHLLLTKTHASNTKIVKIMHVAYLGYVGLIVVVAICCMAYYWINKGQNYIAFMFKPLFWILGTFPIITDILTIDTRVNGFKVLREKK